MKDALLKWNENGEDKEQKVGRRKRRFIRIRIENMKTAPDPIVFRAYDSAKEKSLLLNSVESLSVMPVKYKKVVRVQLVPPSKLFIYYRYCVQFQIIVVLHLEN